MSPGEGRRFAFTVGGAFLAVGVVAWWRGRFHVAAVCVGVGGVLAAAGLIMPGRLTPVYRTWMTLAEVLGKVTTPVFLGVLYFVGVAPLGLIMRLAGRRPLPHPPAGASGWIARSARAHGPEHMKHQF